ncbi:unnamed protein product [Calicophoron daubneyi]|uniref:Uncharacterized protein n=1 Tax=Calicophoron daubneyi TaxID=300641 RepID=A0AAV2TU13_CALDB
MDGLSGLQSWLVVAGGFLAYFLADGYTYSVGVLYSKFLTIYGADSSSTAILPGLLFAVPQFMGIFICPLVDTYGCSSAATWGAIFLSASLLASAFASSLQVLYLTFGVLTSFGLQLTYSSAIIAVTNTFKNSNLFGLAIGLAMCGSGVGSFISSPFLAYLLESWALRDVMIIESGILFNAVVSASCFHHLDAVRFRPTKVRTITLETNKEIQLCQGTDFPNPTCNRIRSQVQGSSLLRYLICIPARFRFGHDSPDKPYNRIEQTGDCSYDVETEERENNAECGCFECLHGLSSSLKQSMSRALWSNPTFLIYVLASGLTGAGIVIPWTFIYDHALVSLTGSAEIHSRSMEQISWLPSLIGLGSLFGQVVFGLLTSQFGDLSLVFSCCCNRRRHGEDSMEGSRLNRAQSHLNRLCSNRHRWEIILFALALVWNGLSSLLIALVPLNQLKGQLVTEVHFLFDFALGQAIAAGCFLVGVSNGAIYVLYPQILMTAVGEQLWASALGIYLAFNGSMNLAGTVLGGYLFDTTGSYQSAFMIAASLPFISLLLIFVQQCVVFIRSRRGSQLVHRLSAIT